MSPLSLSAISAQITTRSTIQVTDFVVCAEEYSEVAEQKPGEISSAALLY